MKKVGIVSCDKWKNLIKEDIFIRDYLIKMGMESEIISWEDQSVNYNNYHCLILKSVWGYQNNYIKFKKWLLFLKSENIILYNNVDIILDNIRKDIQFTILEKNSIEYVPTTFIKSVDEIEKIKLFEPGSIIKPIISGSGDNTFKLTETKSELDKKVINYCDVKSIFFDILKCYDNGLMIQPFVSEIINGEYSCIYINGINTHNMLRFPGIFSEKQKPIYMEKIPGDIKKLSEKVVALNEYENYLYIRVDIVYNQGIPVIMEVELTEPDLLTRYILDSEVKNLIGNQIAKRLERKL